MMVAVLLVAVLTGCSDKAKNAPFIGEWEAVSDSQGAEIKPTDYAKYERFYIGKKEEGDHTTYSETGAINRAAYTWSWKKGNPGHIEMLYISGAYGYYYFEMQDENGQYMKLCTKKDMQDYKIFHKVSD